MAVPEHPDRRDDAGTPRRVVVLGATGAGKSTVAGELARVTGAEHVELDGFHHGPHWTPRPPAEFAVDVADVLTKNAWIVDGNYVDRVSDTVWPHAGTVVWLDLPLWVILPRIVRRTLRRIRRRTALWAGNREQWSSLIGGDSLLTWAVRQHRHLRSALPGRLAELDRSGVHVVRLTSTEAVSRWTAELSNKGM